MSATTDLATGVTAKLYDASSNWDRQDRATLYSGDICQPWKSVYGFSMTAGRLAAGEELVLHCREDEVFALLAGLNELLGSPEALNRAYRLLDRLAQATQQKLTRRLHLRDQPLTDGDIPALIAEVETMLADPSEESVADRLAALLSPHDPTREITGLGKMLAQVRRVMAALERVKHCGFKVAVLDRRRQPRHPNPTPTAAQPDYSPPPQYHLTLWAYLVAKGEGSHAGEWN